MKTVLCSLVCLWMFILGLLVGRGTAPIRFDMERLQNELAALKAATIEETVQRYKVAFQELDREKDLGFHEALKDDETQLPSAALSNTDSATDSISESSDETRVKTEATVPRKSKDSDFQKSSAGEPPDPWAIQVAATQDEAQGNELVSRLEKMGYPAYLVKAAIDSKGTWYRVRVGGYASRMAAEADLVKLKNERFSPIIVSP